MFGFPHRLSESTKFPERHQTYHVPSFDVSNYARVIGLNAAISPTSINFLSGFLGFSRRRLIKHLIGDIEIGEFE